MRRRVWVGLMLAALALATLWRDPSTIAAAADPMPSFEGIWNSATATPLERPVELKDKPFFTAEEADAWERRTAERNSDPAPGAPSRGVGTYNTFFREFGTSTVKTRRTSIVYEPPDGRIPALLPDAAALKLRRLEAMRGNTANPEEFGLQDRCILFSTTGPPLLPYSYNSNYEIVQTKDTIVIHAEMIHDARVVFMNRREHLPPAVRRWSGDSIGRWEGGTLVIDTTNFNDGGGFYGDAGGNFGWDRNLHIVERLRLIDADTMLYQFDVDDPTAFTRPWKGELTMTRAEGPLYEFACHEANYAMENMLRGFRATERAAGEQR